MKKTKGLLSALLLIACLGAGLFSTVFAASTFTQNVTATLGTMKKVSNGGGTLTVNIDTDSGDLLGTLTPAFNVQSNGATSGLQLTAVTGTGTFQALYGSGVSNTAFIVLAQDSVTALAVSDITTAGTPTQGGNPLAIAYPITITSTNTAGTALGAAIYNNAARRFTLTSTGSTVSTTTATVGTTAQPNTYWYDDTSGDYKAAITLSFL